MTDKNFFENPEWEEYICKIGDFIQLKANGVIFAGADSHNTYIDRRASIGKGTIIWPGSFIFGENSVLDKTVVLMPGASVENSVIGAGSVVLKGATIRDSRILNSCRVGGKISESIIQRESVIDEFSEIRSGSIIGCASKIIHSIIENSKLGDEVTVGPFSLIENSTLGDKTSIGHHVLVRRTETGRGVRIPHLSQVTDLKIGDGTNIAKGFTHSNFNGLEKKQTKIGKGCFIATNNNLNGGSVIGDEVRTYPNLFLASKKPIPNHSWVHENDLIKRNSSFKIPGHQRWIVFHQPVVRIEMLSKFLQETGEQFPNTSRGNKEMAAYLKSHLGELPLFTPDHIGFEVIEKSIS